MPNKRSFSVTTWTPGAGIADTTDLTNALHLTVAANATSGILVQEIYMGGLGSASAPMLMLWARNSTVGASPGVLVAPNSDGPLNTLGVAAQAGSVTYVAATTPPKRSVAITAARLTLPYNAFGGIVRWQAAPFQEWGISNVTVNISETSLSAYTGSTAAVAMGSHIIYETYG